MPSINLLPKNIKFGKETMKSGKSKVAFAFSFLMVLFSIASLIGLYINNYYSSKRIELLNSEIKTADEKIKKEVSDNKFLIAEVKAKENNLLLAKHTYFTKAINIIRGSLIDGVYLNSLTVSFEGEEFVDFKFDAVAKNYASIASQTRVFKNLPYIKSVEIKKVSISEEGYKDFNGILKFKKKVLFYGEFYE